MLILKIVTTNPLQITFIGAVIAMVFLASIVGVLVWMLRLPQETERERVATKAVRSVNKLTRILVPLLSKSEATDRVVALAAQMAHWRGGNIELVAAIEVAVSLPLNCRGEEDEKTTLQLLEKTEAVARPSASSRNNIGI